MTLQLLTLLLTPTSEGVGGQGCTVSKATVLVGKPQGSGPRRLACRSLKGVPSMDGMGLQEQGMPSVVTRP